VLVENERLEQFRAQRYAGWDTEFGRKILAGGYSLESLATDALAHGVNPQHVSGQQERLENVVNQAIYGSR
jgi:xylose isomerase